jgi:RNA polymerase sigma-70 factor (ECF subfamily)
MARTLSWIDGTAGALGIAGAPALPAPDGSARPIQSASPAAEVRVDAEADPDQPLVAAVARGDERALAALVRRHGPRLRAIALGYAAAAAEADDIVQETFFTVWRTAARFEPRGAKVSTWLCRIAINRCIDLERRRKLRRFVGLDEAAEQADAALGADVVAGDRADLAAVMADIRALPERQRAAILLAADGERSNGEIASALGVSLGAAEQLLVRARRTLREKLAARGGAPG